MKKALDAIKGMWEAHKAPTPPFFRAIGNSILAAGLMLYELAPAIGLEKYEGKVITVAVIMKFLTTLKGEKK